MPSTKELTIEEAEMLARRMDTRRETWAGIMRDAAELSGRFSDATATDVVRMWRAGRNEKGRPLSKFEVQALGERWCEVFGCFPPGDNVEATQPAVATEPEPADTTMLAMNEVIRLTGLSKSTVKRMVDDGRFPRPTHLSPRRIGWPAGDVKAWLEQLDRGNRR